MDLLKEIGVKEGLMDRERRILEVLLNHGGEARFKDFTGAFEGKGMTRRTIDKRLKALIKMGILEKRRKRVEGRMTWIYVFQSREVLEIFGRMEKQMGEITAQLYLKTMNPGLDRKERRGALSDGVTELLEFQNALTLMGIKLTLTAPDERTAAHRLIMLLDRFTNMAAANAWGICWLNKDIAADVLEAMLPKVEEGNE